MSAGVPTDEAGDHMSPGVPTDEAGDHMSAGVPTDEAGNHTSAGVPTEGGGERGATMRLAQAPIGESPLPPRVGENLPPPVGENLPPPVGENLPPPVGENLPPPVGENLPPRVGENLPPPVGENRRLPPADLLLVASMGLVVTAGIYLAAYLPTRAPLAPAVALLVASGALLLVAVGLVGRLRPFAWEVFFRVLGWAVLAYVVIAGMLEFIFVFDHTRGSMLVILTLSLVVFAVDIPVLFAFSVARYQPVPIKTGEPPPLEL